MRTFVLALICFLLSNNLSSQNLIPNGSFELVKKPIDEKITGSRAGFDNKLYSWYCPTNVSPDIYLPHPNNDNFPDHFRLPNAKEGEHFIGLVMEYPYNVCKTYREYVQVQLKDTLEIGTTYIAEFWVSPRRNDVYTLGVFFSQDKLVNDKCSMLLKKPQLSYKDSLKRWEWKKLSFEITPSEPYTHITVGNFAESYDMKDRYCFFDDFRLRKKGTSIAIKREINVEKSKKPITDPLPTKTKTPVLETVFNASNIQFEHGKYDLLSSSFLELDQLIFYLEEHPTLKLMLEGHTDNSGNAKANQELSTNRVKSVLAYMTKKGITPDRIRYKSHGATQPIASNDTEEGRELNRRVTFLIEE